METREYSVVEHVNRIPSRVEGQLDARIISGHEAVRAIHGPSCQTAI